MVDTAQLLACAFEQPTPTDFEGRKVLCWILERALGGPVFLTLDPSQEPAVAVVLDGAEAEPGGMWVAVPRDLGEVLSLINYLQNLVAAGRAA